MSTPPLIAFARDSMRHSGGTSSAIPPNSVCTASCAPGASCASRRSTEIPPNHASIEPPLNAFARLLSSIPSRIATSESSSLSSSPRDGSARFTNSDAAKMPSHEPNAIASSVRSGRVFRA